MNKPRTAAALVGLLLVAGLTRAVSRPASADIPAAISAALTSIEAPGRPIAILSESPVVDRAVAAALGSSSPPRASLLVRDAAAIEAAAATGDVLALQEGRRYLELRGFELEWLPQPTDRPAFPWARVRARLHCAPVRDDRWSPLPGVEYTGRLGIHLPPALEGKLVLIVGDAVPLDIEAQTADGMTVPMRSEVLRAGPASSAPADFWLGDGNPWSAPGAVVRLTIDARPARERLFGLGLGRRAPRVLARLKDYGPAARAEVCAAPLGVDAAFRRESSVVVLPDTPEYFGTGWYGPELGSSGLGVVRWMKGQGTILVPSARRGTVDVVVHGAAATADATTLTLTVNDVFTAPPMSLVAGRPRYQWKIPAPTWLAGTNELLFTVSRTARPFTHDTRDLGFALQRLEVTLEPH